MDIESIGQTGTLVVVGALLVLERLQGWRRRPTPIRKRWLTNLGLMFLGGLTLSLLFSQGVIDVAADVEGGLLHWWPLPPVLEIALVFLLLDLWRYWEHRIYHELPLLWRFHLVHHSDTGLDFTTAERHHPVEAILAVCTTLLLVFSLGISATALALYTSSALLLALISHANVKLPEAIDRHLRGWLVTPSVHAIHHSDFQPQTDSNYGSVFVVWDRLFGTYRDPAAQDVNYYGLEYFHIDEDQALGPVLLQPFEYRSNLAYLQRDAAAAGDIETNPFVLTVEWRQALASMAVGLMLALAALWPTVTNLAQVWAGSEPYQYAWLVIPMFIYLVGWYHRDSITAMTPRQDLLGLVVIGAAMVLWCLADLVDIQLGQHVALVLVLQGVILSSVGRSIFRQFLPIMLLLFFMVPCGDLLQSPLRGLTVKWIEWLALLVHAPLRIDGFMAYVGEQRYVVVDACSGLTFVTLAAFLGYSFGLMVFHSFGRTVGLAVFGAAIGVLTNAVRVWLIVGIDWLRGTQMDMAAHMDLQWIALLAALGTMFYCVVRFARNDDRADSARCALNSTSDWRRVRLAPVFAGALVAIVLLPMQGLFAGPVHSAAIGPLQKLASMYRESDWLDSEGSGSSTLLLNLDGHLQVIVSKPVAANGRPDISHLSPEDSRSWRHARSGRLALCDDKGNCVDFVHLVWRRKGSDDSRHALYTYYVGERVTPSKLRFRLARGWDRLSGHDSEVGVFGLKMRGDLSNTEFLAEHYFRIRTELRGG